MSAACSFAFVKWRGHKAVYWGNPVNDGYGGRTFDEPVEIDVRWVEDAVLFVNVMGQEVRSSAIVYLGEDVDVGGYLVQGTLLDLSSADVDPLVVRGAQEIRGFVKIPNYSGTRYFRKAFL